MPTKVIKVKPAPVASMKVDDGFKESVVRICSKLVLSESVDLILGNGCNDSIRRIEYMSWICSRDPVGIWVKHKVGIKQI